MSEQLRRYATAIRDKLEPYGWLSKTGPPSAYAECLAPLLVALGWNGEIHQLCESLPHYPDQIDRVNVVNVMANLNYDVNRVAIHSDNFDERLAPCLVVMDEGKDVEQPYVFFQSASEGLMVFDGSSGSVAPLSSLPAAPVSLYTFTPLSSEVYERKSVGKNVEENKLLWLKRMLLKFRPVGGQIIVTSLIINLLALVSSLYVMAVYDKVIGSRSLDTLYYLGAGALLAIGFESALRYLRARSLAFFGVRLDAIMTAAIFDRLLFLPPRIVENSSIPAQVARLKDFDSVRNFFAGPVGVSMHEIPFTLIFIFTIWIIGGPLVKVPLLLALAYGLLGLVMLPRIQSCTEEGAMAGVKRQSIMVETMRKYRAIRLHGIKVKWLERYRELSGISSYTSFNSSLQTAIVESLAYGLSVAAGAITLTYGIFLVWDGTITTGALIASMMLVWRVISPLQVICNSLVRVRYVFRSVGQVHKLLRSTPENSGEYTEHPLQIRGDIAFAGVGLRYTADRPAVFSGVTLEIKHGEIVAVAGSSGVGKSSLLKLIMGLYPPQMGSVRIDGMDIRQRDPVSLRRNISYQPQTSELFHGSIEQNLRMCKPDATEDELRGALHMSGALEEVEKLNGGMNYYIGDYRSEQLSSALHFQLTLARAYLRDSKIMLFDEIPPDLLGKTTGVRFRQFLHKQRGQKTIVFVTDREEEILAVDRLIYLTGAGQVLTGDPGELLAALKK